MKKKKKGAFEKKLKAYSAVATGALLLAPSANAAVQYSGIQNIDLNFGQQTYILNLNGDAVNDFSFDVWTSNSVATGVGIYPLTANASWIDDYSYYDPARLPAGYLVQNTLIYTPTYNWDNESNDTLASTVTDSTSGMFNNRIGCIGVRFDVGVAAPDIRYGWIQFQGTVTPGVSATGRIIDWAYEDTGAPILTGAGGPPGTCASAPPTPVPTFNQWGLIVLIALLAGAGTLMLRKREEA